MIISAVVEHGTIYALTGAFTGFMSGVLGIGGGMIVVPALLFIFHHTHIIPPEAEMHAAAGSSLAIMIFTAISAVTAHSQRGDLLWPLFLKMCPGLLVGTISGALLADQLSTAWLKSIFGVLLVIIAVRMLLTAHKEAVKKVISGWVNAVVSLFIGILSGLLGIGGGTFIIPYLSLCGVDAKKIPAVSSLSTLVVGLIGTVSFAVTGLNASDMPSFSTGYIFWPAVLWVSIPSILFAPVGAKMTYKLPVKQLKYGLISILLLAAIDMLF